MIKYIACDATKPIGEGNKIIVHVCNDSGGFGKGFVLSLTKRWDKPKKVYNKYYKQKELNLGDIQIVKVEDDIIVINMIAQKGYINPNNKVPLQYSALEKCFLKVKEYAMITKSSIHGPKFGSGLSGGDWSKIELMINNPLVKFKSLYI